MQVRTFSDWSNMPIPAQISISYPELRNKYEFRKRVLTLASITCIFVAVISLIMSALANAPGQPALTEAVAAPSRMIASSLLPMSAVVVVVMLVLALVSLGLMLHARRALRNLYPQEFRRDH